MFRYLKAAFLVRPHVPGLGHFPVNAVAAACFAVLGFAHPAFWLVGLAVEVALVSALASNARFRRVVDATEGRAAESDSDTKFRQLVGRLSDDARRRLDALDGRCARAAAIHQEVGTEQYVVESGAEALRHLRWAYLKLLLAGHYLRSDQMRADEKGLRDKAAAVERELADEKLSPPLRESKSATLKILRQRLQVLQQREQSLRAIESDLERIEAQVELAVESAAVRGRPQDVEPAVELKLASDLLDPGLYGAWAPDVAAIEQTFHPPAPAAEAGRSR